MKELRITSPLQLLNELNRFRFIKAIDLETTGLDSSAERVIEYGSYAVDFYGNKLTEVDLLINPERNLPPKITEITKLTDLDLFDKPKFRDVSLSIFYDMVRSSDQTILIAHNAQFDMGFLTSEFKKLGIDLDQVDITYLCTRNLARCFNQLGLFDNQGSNRLEHLMHVLGIEDPNHHRSINDCLMCINLFKQLIEMAR